MRSLAIAIGGLALSIGMWGHSQVIHGFGGASLVLLSLFVAPIAVALAIAEAPHSLRGGRLAISGGSRSFGRTTHRPRRISSRCHGCGRRRQLCSEVWICSRCDVGERIRENW